MSLPQETQAKEYKELLDAGHLSQAEYKDLIEDLKREVEMIEDTNAMQMKSDCIKALDLLLKLM
jgi:polyhydroxyalkanoate synthesis regulator phasin